LRKLTILSLFHTSQLFHYKPRKECKSQKQWLNEMSVDHLRCYLYIRVYIQTHTHTHTHMHLPSFSPGDNRKRKNKNCKNKYGTTHFDVELEKVSLKLIPPY